MFETETLTNYFIFCLKKWYENKVLVIKTWFQRILDSHETNEVIRAVAEQLKSAKTARKRQSKSLTYHKETEFWDPENHWKIHWKKNERKAKIKISDWADQIVQKLKVIWLEILRIVQTETWLSGITTATSHE